MNKKLWMGFFPAFKGRDTVLVSGSSLDIKKLITRMEEFVGASATSLDLNSFSTVAPQHPVTLLLTKPAEGAKAPNGFLWLCGKDQFPDIREKLRALSEVSKGHQYFDLIGSPAQLMISVGEYPDHWWTEAI